MRQQAVHLHSLATALLSPRQKLKPVWKELAKGRKTVGAVDCTSHKDLCSKYGVTGFPTVSRSELDSTCLAQGALTARACAWECKD